MNQNQQDFEKLFRTELESVKFEINESDFHDLSPILMRVLELSSLKSLDCDISIYEQILKKVSKADEEKFNLFNVSFLLNAISQVSPKELGLSPFQYVAYAGVVKRLSDEWNELMIPIRTKLLNKMKTQEALQGPKNGMSVIPGRR